MNLLEQKLQEITQGLDLDGKHQVCYTGDCYTFEVELRSKTVHSIGSLVGRLRECDDHWTIKISGTSGFPGTSIPAGAQAAVDFYQDLTNLLSALQSKESEIYQATPGHDEN